MNPRLLLLIVTALGSLVEAVPTESTSGPPTAGVTNDHTNDVIVRLPPPAGTPAPASAPEAVAVHPEESVSDPDTEPAEVPPASAPADAPPPAESQPGLTVQVENLQTGNLAIDPKTVKLLAPFPAKPLGPTPAGWSMATLSTAPLFTRKVELAPNASITLKIRPQVLVPVADGAATFAINEPGFEPTLGYRQLHTVGAILALSIDQLDEDSKQLGNAIERLQQLVSSLPQTTGPAVTNPKPSDPR